MTSVKLSDILMIIVCLGLCIYFIAIYKVPEPVVSLNCVTPELHDTITGWWGKST